MVEGKPHQLPDQEKGAQLPVARCEQESERRARRGKRKKDVLQQDGQGGIISSRNLNRVKRAVLNIDPTAFITISNVSEINGNGFTTMFGDEEYVPIVSQRREGIKVIEDEGKN